MEFRVASFNESFAMTSSCMRLSVPLELALVNIIASYIFRA